MPRVVHVRSMAYMCGMFSMSHIPFASHDALSVRHVRTFPGMLMRHRRISHGPMPFMPGMPRVIAGLVVTPVQHCQQHTKEHSRIAHLSKP